MKRGQVWIPSSEGGRMPARFEPVWAGSGEVPLYTVEYEEGHILYYGSGTGEVVMLGVPIIARVPVAVVGTTVHIDLDLHRRRELSMALRKISAAVGTPGGGGPGVSDVKTWPTLVEYLTTTTYPDGQPRVPSALVIVADSNGWRGCLSDKDNARSLWKTSDALEGLLLALEEAAASDDPSAWRQSAEAKWKGKKRS